MATCSACGHSGHTKASILCRLKGNRAPGSADPAATAVATAAASRYVGLHCPVKKANVVYSDWTRNEGRQRCKMCKSRVNTYCEQCDVALCFGDYENPDKSCFKKYHTYPKK